MSIKTKNNRYSEADLSVFKTLVEQKIVKVEDQLHLLETQLSATAQAKDNEGDWMDDSSINSNIEMLEVMVNRQRKHLMDLQNALQRIYNKSYGICVVSDELIDKKRLLAVPTTTKSLAAKVGIEAKSEKKTFTPIAKAKTDRTPKVYSRIIRKSDNTAKPKVWEDDEELEEETDGFEISDTAINFDNYSEEDIEN